MRREFLYSLCFSIVVRNLNTTKLEKLKRQKTEKGIKPTEYLMDSIGGVARVCDDRHCINWESYYINCNHIATYHYDARSTSTREVIHFQTRLACDDRRFGIQHKINLRYSLHIYIYINMYKHTPHPFHHVFLLTNNNISDDSNLREVSLRSNVTLY